MSWGPLLVNLAVTAVTVAALMLATFAYAMRTRVQAIMDTVARVLVLALTAVWGLRLSAHIYRPALGAVR
jgi:steroid 5-alpha reductase family enzyme